MYRLLILLLWLAPAAAGLVQARAQCKTFMAGPTGGSGLSWLSFTYGGTGTIQLPVAAYRLGINTLWRPPGTLGLVTAFSLANVGGRTAMSRDTNCYIDLRQLNASFDIALRIYADDFPDGFYFMVGTRHNLNLAFKALLSPGMEALLDWNHRYAKGPSPAQYVQQLTAGLAADTRDYMLNGLIGLGLQLDGVVLELEFAPGLTRMNRTGDNLVHNGTFCLKLSHLF